MAYYGGVPDRLDRAKAVAAVAAVHVGLAAVILSGLNVEMARRAVETLRTFDVSEPPPPPPQPRTPPRPAEQPQKAKLREGAEGKKAEPTPVVAPKPRIRARSPIVAANFAGTGSAPHAGAGRTGTGPGAGGSGDGPGGGGLGDFSSFTPAQIVRRIPHREYRRISAGRIPLGSATITFRVTPDGRMANCKTVRTSGDAYVDSVVCDAATRHMRFRPARDPSGRAVAQQMTYTPTWRPNRWE